MRIRYPLAALLLASTAAHAQVAGTPGVDSTARTTATAALTGTSALDTNTTGDGMSGSIAMAAWKGQTYDLAAHGAKGDATSDDTAMAGAITYAAAHPGTRILIPSTLSMTAGTIAGEMDLIGPGPTNANNLGGFTIPAETTLAGIDQNQSVIHYVNDYGAVGTGGAANAYQNLITSAGGSDITLENFTVRGNWNVTGSSLPASGYGEANAIFMAGGTDMTVRNVTSEYQYYFGMTLRGILGVNVEDITVRWTGTDQLNMDNSGNISVKDSLFQHAADDQISAHSAYPGDVTGGKRRFINITGDRFFDGQGVRILAADDTNISGNAFDSVTQQAINVESVTPSGGSYQEGPSASTNITIVGNHAANLISRTNVDGKSGGVDFVTVAGYGAEKGNYGAVPGENDSTSTDATYGTVIDPYKEFLRNNPATTTPIAGSSHILIAANTVSRLFPATNNSDTRFPNWNSLGQGLITTKVGTSTANPNGNSSTAGNPTLAESDIEGTCFDLQGGYGADILIDGNDCSGQSTGVNIGGSGHWKGVTVSNNHFFDFSSYALFVNNSARNNIVFNHNFLDGDPYLKSASRKVVTAGSNTAAHDGTWANNGGPVGVYLPNGTGIEMGWNILQDVSVDVAGLPSDTVPAVGFYLHDNIDRANNVTATLGLNYLNPNWQGVGEIHQIGFEVEPWDSNPQDAAFDTLLTAPLKVNYAMPTSGYWVQGHFVQAVGSPNVANPIFGYLRLTTGSSNVLYTDWWPLYAGQGQGIRTITAAGPLATGDCGGTVRWNGTATGSLPVPTGLPLGCQIGVLQVAPIADAFTITAGTGETIEAASGAATPTAQYLGVHVLIDSASTFNVTAGP